MHSVTKASGAAASPSARSAIRVAASRNSTALRRRPFRTSGVQGLVRTMSAVPFPQMLNEPSPVARDSKAVFHDVADYRIITRREQFADRVLKGPRIVAGPSADVGCQSAYLGIPDINRRIVGADQKNVYIAFLGHGATSRRAKYSGVLWLHIPIFEMFFDL